MSSALLHRSGQYLRSLFAPPERTESAKRLRKILVVDDDPNVLKTISLKLNSRGYAVATAIDGSAAIGAVRDEHPDLVVLDLSFPPDVANGGRVTWDGFQIMSWLRGLNEANSIPFIIITAGDPALYRERSLASGAAAFFQKPIQHDHLLRVIKQVLDDHDQRCVNEAAR